MKTLLLAGVLSFLPIGTFAQIVYRVPANSQGNEIVLTIANESPETPIDNVQVQVSHHASPLGFATRQAFVKVVPAAGEAQATFTFDVARTAIVGKKDTVEFLLSDGTGASWRKLVVISYAGPETFKLEQNFPNPFNPATTIYYELPVDSKVTMKVYDMLGREVRGLLDEEQQAGYRDIRFDSASLASGAYICRLHAQPTNGSKAFVSAVKMLLLR
jgi:hypothetical protein